MSEVQLNWVDRVVEVFSPSSALQRARSRYMLNALTGYESSEPSRKRRFHRNTMAGDALSRTAAVPLRNQARHLERNSDLASGALDRLTDFIVGPNGITVEPQPRKLDGTIHDGIAEELERAYETWSEWPEVTWTHNRASMERLICRTEFRDGESLGQLIEGPQTGLEHGSSVPFSIEMLEPDFLPHDLDNLGGNVRQGIERNTWGRPVAYHVYYTHPGDDRQPLTLQTRRVPAERMMHLRRITRIGQLRGISQFAPVIARFQDLHEYENSERMAAKMAASLVLKLTRGDAQMWDPATGYDPAQPPVYQMDGGMIVANTAPGESAEFYDSTRPNTGNAPWIAGELRRASAGLGLSYSTLARDYNGTYSSQRQELVENWPHFHAETGLFVSQWSRPARQRFVRWWALSRGKPLPADLDVSTLADALYLGPPMPWIDPEREANSQLILVQAAFKSSAAVVRERGGSLRDTYRQISAERRMREDAQIGSTVDVPATNVLPAKPAAPEITPAPAAPSQPSNHLRVVK